MLPIIQKLTLTENLSKLDEAHCGLEILRYNIAHRGAVTQSDALTLNQKTETRNKRRAQING